MIQYALKCADGHGFDSWFQSADAFDKLAAGGMVTCPSCGSTDVQKAIMTPRVRPARKAAAVPEGPEDKPLAAPASKEEAALAKLRKEIEANADYVGVEFASEARAMHDGDIPERAIYGEARPEDARKLLEDGVPVAPLPFIPQRRTN